MTVTSNIATLPATSISKSQVRLSSDVVVKSSQKQQDSPTYRDGEVPLQTDCSSRDYVPESSKSWGIDTVKIAFKVDTSQCDSESPLWVGSSTQNLRNDQPDAQMLRGFYVLPNLTREVRVVVELYLLDGLCRMSFNAARVVFQDKEDLLPPDALKPLVEGLINALFDVVWPQFVTVTSDGEIVWDANWMQQVRISRLDLARNFEVRDSMRLRHALPLVRGKYQRQKRVYDSGGGCWTIEVPTSCVGKDKLYTKSAQLALDPDDAARMASLSGELVRFETQMMRNRLKDHGLNTLDRIDSRSTWMAMRSRWDSTGWGSPLPQRGDLLKAVDALKAKDRVLLIGYLHLAAVNAQVNWGEASERRMRMLAKQCGLTIGLPIELVGPPETYLDLVLGTEAPINPKTWPRTELEDCA